MTNALETTEFEHLPTLYQRWIAEWLPGGIPREQNATCQDCAMCADTSVDLTQDMGYYDRSLKCCTYFPDLPNFLVGRALAGENPGAAALGAFVEGRDEGGVATLLSVAPNAKFATIYDHHSKAGFGRDPELLCPYAIEKEAAAGSRCGIWQQRNGVCSTYFCKHVKGQTGFQFWQTLRGLLGALEWSLAWWAVTELVDDPAAVFTAGAVRAGDRNAIALRPDAWRFWPGTRTSFYESCAERVEALSADEAVAIAGATARLYGIELQQRYGTLRETEPPAHLQATPFNVLKQDGARATIQALTCSEPFEAPAALVPLLAHFDGTAPVDETIESIREITRVRLDRKLVRRLYDFGILACAPAAPAGNLD